MAPDHGKASHWPIEQLLKAADDMKSKEAFGQMELTYLPMGVRTSRPAHYARLHARDGLQESELIVLAGGRRWRNE